MIDEFKNINTTKIFFGYCLLIIVFSYLQHSILVNDQLYYNALSDQLSDDRIAKMLELEKKWQWIGYAVVPIGFALKFSLVSICLLIGSIFYNYKLEFSDSFKIALLSDIVFVIPTLLKFTWFLIIQKSYSLEDIERFSPFSLLNFFDSKKLSSLWYYPLSTLNLFELLYIFSLAFWLYKFGVKSYDLGLKIALSAYLPGLIVWIILVMFITININPQV